MNPIEIIENEKIFAVLRNTQPEETKNIITSLIKGGIKVIEIVLQTPEMVKVIEDITKQKDRPLIMAGGIITQRQAQIAIDSGADVIVSPVFQMNLVRLCKSQKTPLIMTATTPNEAYSAWKARTQLIKISPANPMGGAEYIEDILRPMKFINIIAAGSIKIDDIPSYIKAGAKAVGIGRDFYNGLSYDLKFLGDMMTKLIFEKSKKGVNGVNITDEKVNFDFIDAKYLSDSDKSILPEVSELEVMRHYKELSDKNFCIEKGFYPLGSCTMKYNPKVNELLASLDGFCELHPLQSDSDSQGALKLMYNLQEALKKVTGMDAVTLQPAAGAHGELTGMMIVKKYFDSIGQTRKNVIIPDSAHGTNPASAAMCGFNIIEIKSNNKGQVDINALKSVLDENTAAIMLTNPNTLGIFEENILEISKLVHEAGGLLYYDGANMNAIMGHTNPKLMGYDIVHMNLHKTFSTPHGGGGPGAGPVGVVDKLKEFLPVPVIDFDGNSYYRRYDLKNSIGKVKAFYGNFSVLVKAYAYILLMGNELKNVSENAVLNANYMMNKLKKYYNLPYDTKCMHEFVLSGDWQKEDGVNTLAIAKCLMDSNFHPPTVYFPLIVHEAIMIEPTESESKERLDDFIDTMIDIAKNVKSNPQAVLNHPISTPVKKVDETLAARKPDLAYKI